MIYSANFCSRLRCRVFSFFDNIPSFFLVLLCCGWMSHANYIMSILFSVINQYDVLIFKKF